MRIMTIFITFLVFLLPFLAAAQGRLEVFNPGARTRVGSLLGPEAGSGYWGQMLAGLTPDSLTPVGMPVEHNLVTGLIFGGVVEVPGIDGNMVAYIQMWAWNGTQWGTSLDAVPPDQFGKTDIVPLRLSYSFDPAFAPRFTVPAVVPIPEPSTVALAVVGAGALWFATRARRRK